MTEKECVCRRIFKKHKGVISVAIAILLVGAVCYFGCSQRVSEPTYKIAVLDIEKIRAGADAYKTVAAEQKKYEEVWETKFKADRSALDQEDRELAAKRNKMKEKELRSKVELLQRKAIALQQKYQAEASKILAATSSVVRQVDTVVLEAAQKMAAEQGYAIVLPKQVTLYADKTVDLTEAFLMELNKKSIKITYPNPDTLTPEQMPQQ